MDTLTLQELYQTISAHPGLLRRTLILDEKRLQVDITKMRFVDFCLVKFVLYSVEKINEWPINVDKPILLKFCKLYPDQYVKLNILNFYLENDRRIVTDVALINVIEDSKLATK